MLCTVRAYPPGGGVGPRWKPCGGAASHQGLILVHYSAQRKHILWDTLGA